MTSTLHFKLPEDQAEFTQASNAGQLASVIWEAQQNLRAYFKHGDPDSLKLAREHLESLRDLLNTVDHIVTP